MRTDQRPASRARLRLESPTGSLAEANAHGALTRFEAHGLSLLLNPATSIEAGPTNVHLRVLDGESVRRTPLLGQASPSRVAVVDDALLATGQWHGLDYALSLVLGREEATWAWHLEVVNTTDAPVRIDAVLTQDPALAPVGAVANNQYYVSQYLDLTPVDTPDHGVAVAVRQNMPGEQVPWVVVGSLGRGVRWSTDVLQLVERTAGGPVWSGLDRPDLPSTRLQHEHALAAVQDEAVVLAPGATHRTGFFGLVAAGPPGRDRPGRRTPRRDRGPRSRPLLRGRRRRAEGRTTTVPEGPASALATSPVLSCVPLTADDLQVLDLAADEGSTEHDADGTPTTWRTPRGEVVTTARELEVLRPHGQILRTGDTLTPDPGSMTTTVWMSGTFHSQVTVGHVGRDPLLTGRRSYLGLFRGQGLRVLVRDTDDAGWHLLDLPSAWCNGLDACVWWYAAPDGRLIEVESRAPAERHELTLTVRVLRGPATRLLVTLDTGSADAQQPDLGWTGAADVVRDEDWLVVDVEPTKDWRLTFPAADARKHAGDADFWTGLTGSLDLALDGDTRGVGGGRGRRRRPPVVHPQRPGPLPRAPRPRAVLRRRLGHPRRLPGTGRPAHGTGPARRGA